MKRTDISSAVRRANAGKIDGFYYVYEHTRKTDGSVFYVGKGIGDRAWHTYKRSEYWKRIVAKHGRDVRIVACFDKEELALEYEKLLIARYTFKGVHLCNLTLGGDGASKPLRLMIRAAAVKVCDAKGQLSRTPVSELTGKPPKSAVRRVKAAQKKLNDLTAVLRCQARLPSFDQISQVLGVKA